MRARDLTQADLDDYAERRRTGRIKSPRHRTPLPGARNGTIRNEMHTLRAVTRWALAARRDGHPLLRADPLAHATLPIEKNPKRPMSSEARYQALLAVAHARLRVVLAIARHSGHRINAIMHLAVSDLLLTSDALARGLAESGTSGGDPAQWPSGAIRWRAAFDKRGITRITPISAALRVEIDAYLRTRPALGDCPLIPAALDPSRCATKESAMFWLTRAETLANVPKLARGAFHPYRRLWASERRHLPAQDVARAGGWKSIAVMQSIYQHADAVGEHAAVENLSTGDIAETALSATRARIIP